MGTLGVAADEEGLTNLRGRATARGAAAASAGGGEGMETEGPAVGSKRGRSESRAATRRDSSLMARSRSPSNMGLKDEAQ
eukprot:3636215-Prymnesium_polylepis.1